MLPIKTRQQCLFSSSSSPKPSLLDGFDGFMQFANRCVDRLGQLERYRRENVFPPSHLGLYNYVLYNKLQLPTNTEIDAVDFLDGAKFACDLTMNTMYSREFINFATGKTRESPAAETLKQGLSGACFDAFVFAMQETTKSGTSFSLTQLDFNGVYLSGVHWDRLSLAELKSEHALEELSRAQLARLDAEQGRPEDRQLEDVTVEVRPEELVAKITPEDHAIMVERMRLDVQFHIKESLDVTTPEMPVQSIERESAPVWRFESMVTQPEDVDWRIVSVV